MEIKSRKMSKTEKMQKMCILLGVIIIIIVLVFMPNGFISAINAIKMKQLSVWELMIMSFLSFVPMWIVIEDIVLGMISCQISYRLKENGIEILYKGKVRRAYKWDEMRTHRIVYMGKGTLRNSEDFWCNVKACVVFSTRRIKDSFFQSPFPFEAWNEQISGVCLLFPGVAMLVAMAVWFFRKRRVVKIYLDNRESFSKDNIYYSSVNKKYFLQKMKEWHVELEDNKPEEIPPWKEQI